MLSQGKAAMNRFRDWAFNFMNGRYGFDELGRSMGIWVIVLIIATIILQLLTALFNGVLGITNVAVLTYVLYRLAMLATLVLIIVMVFRFLSRKRDKRSAENERYLARKRANAAHGASKTQDLAQNIKDKREYKYLDCAFCGQKMRVPRGKGKIAVKCPACGEKTIIKS